MASNYHGNLYDNLCQDYDILKVRSVSGDIPEPANNDWMSVFWDDLTFGVANVGDLLGNVRPVQFGEVISCRYGEEIHQAVFLTRGMYNIYFMEKLRDLWIGVRYVCDCILTYNPIMIRAASSSSKNSAVSVT